MSNAAPISLALVGLLVLGACNDPAAAPQPHASEPHTPEPQTEHYEALLVGEQGKRIPDPSPAMPDALPIVTTALPVLPLNAFPGSFQLETLTRTSAGQDFQIDLYFPQSIDPADAAINTLLRKRAESIASRAHPLPGEDSRSGHVECWVDRFYRSERFLSVRFVSQSYFQGAAHYNHGYTSFNYDRVDKRERTLPELFKLGSQAEKAAFCEAFNAAIEEPYVEPLTPAVLGDRTDYTITGEALLLNFDDFTRGPSTEELAVPLASLTSFLQPGF